MKHPVWTCESCGYEWKQSVGAQPLTAACPSCGADVATLAATLPKPESTNA